jgi:outer membrane protein OmpA-like peptidoglycan-associated protein
MVAGTLALGAALPVPAQEIPAATKPNAQRTPLPVPKTPDLTMAPLPASPPDEPEVSPAPPYTLPPPRLVTGGGAGEATVAPSASVTGGNLTLLFSAGEEELTDPMLTPLADVAKRLKAHPSERLDVRAHATGPADRASDARRTALLRARAVRDQLVSAGIDPLRMNIFAEGTLVQVPAAGQPLPVPDAKAPSPDRVDLVFRP